MPTTLVIVATTDLASDQRLQRAASALHGDRLQVTLLGRVLPSSPTLEAHSYRQIRLRCPINTGMGFYLLYNLQILFWLLRHRPEAVTACDADTLVGASIGARLIGARLYFDAHEYFSEVPEVVRRPFVQAVWRTVERRFIPWVDVAYTVGPALASRFSELYGKPFATVRNVPLRKDYELLERNPVQNRIVYTGALNEGRGLQELLHALALEPTYTAVICGDGPLEYYLHALSASLALQDRVRFTGRLLPSDLRHELSQAWLGFSLLVPTGESYRLSLANKFFDYIQAGLPQICPALPEYQAVLAVHPVGMALPCMVNAIREALHRFATPGFYQEAVSACNKAAPSYTWEHEQHTLRALYGLE